MRPGAAKGPELPTPFFAEGFSRVQRMLGDIMKTHAKHLGTLIGTEGDCILTRQLEQL